MPNRRTAISLSVAAAATSFRRPSFAQESPPTDKARFIVAAMDQQRIEIAEQAAEMARKGQFGYITPPPNIVPFGDWDFFYLKDGEAMWWANEGQTYAPVTVPVGFVSDLASVPSLLWSAYPAQGRYAIAAIIHDWLYWVQDRPREEADDILYTAMLDAKVDTVTSNAFWAAVRAGGGGAWDGNIAKKAAGEKRVLQKFPPDLLVAWADWKQQPGVFAD